MADFADNCVNDDSDWNLFKEMFVNCIEEEELSDIFARNSCVLDNSINDALLLLEYYDSTINHEIDAFYDQPTVIDDDISLAKDAASQIMSTTSQDWPTLPSNSTPLPSIQSKSASKSDSLFQDLVDEFGSLVDVNSIQAAVNKSKNNKRKARNILLQKSLGVRTVQVTSGTSALKSYSAITAASKLSPDATAFVPRCASLDDSQQSQSLSVDVGRSREFYLQEASNAYRQMKDCFVNAVLLRRSSSPSSGILKVREGYQHKKKMREMAARAAIVVFQLNNSEFTVSFPSGHDGDDVEDFIEACYLSHVNGLSRRWKIDLHGLRVQEALGLTRAIVYSLLQDLTIGRCVELQIITGRGKHSDKSIAKLQPTIETALKKLGYTTRTIDFNIGLISTEIRQL